MTVFILSLAGIPGTAGFIGKINIFLGALHVEPAHYVLASIMMGTTVISFVYYFRILQQMFFRTGRDRRKAPITVKYKDCHESLRNFNCNTRDYADDWLQFLL